MAAVRPGVTAEQVDAARPRAADPRALGSGSSHRTGHGIGLDVHEEPYIVGGNTRRCEPGHGLQRGAGGVPRREGGARIEDIVVVTADGAEPLNTARAT